MESGVPRIAIVHEWLITYAGSEKVLEAMLQVFPDADVFCALDFLPEQFRGGFRNTKIKTSFVQRIPFARHIHRYLLALMPLAVEQHDLSGYDIVISNSHAVAKGCLTSAGQLHICYCYTPIRYAWDLQFQYLAESNLVWGLRSIIARWTLHKIRIWDARTPPSEVPALIGDASKAAQKLGWTPKIGLEEIIQEMVASDIHRAKAVPLSLKA